jgi:toxin ParE1/3/4
MAVVILPDAQDDLLSLQEHMLDQWGEIEWLKAEDEIFEKLEQVDAGNYPGTAV